ncbi:MAG TPA: hypothetical protein VD761_07795 [Solirubrobacterales bacterium]|nr:hypothetical protein [Solirubrobacterales bacterium]
MARTEAGRLLTEQHHTAQIQVRARALRDYLRLWPIWNGDEESFNQMAAAAIVLVRAYHGLSATLASSYFQSFRLAEQVAGEAAIRPAGPIDESKVLSGLVVTGRDSVADALRAGRSPEDARRAALTRTSGSITRQVLTGGRETLVRSVAEDKEALGWGRVTDGNPCPFCALLASRGPVYKEETVDFEAHDHCTCAAMPFYKGADWPARGREFKALYDRSVREARQARELRRGTSNDLLNAFRRYLNHQGEAV